MPSFMDRIKTAAGYEPTPVPEPTLLQQWQSELGEATTLSMQQRAWLFGGTVLFTAVFWGLGSFSLMMVHISSFVFFFTLGNITAVASTCFLVGPGKQFRTMFTKQRMGAATTFLAAMLLTLFASFKFKGLFQVFIIVIPCLCIQMIALLWYCSTYIPGGQGFMMRIIGQGDINDIV